MGFSLFLSYPLLELISSHINQFPNHGDLGFESNGRDMCRFRSEATAYQTLKASGYASGYIPDFYGCAVVDPTQFLPHLDAFLGDKYFPNAVLMEYLPNPKPVTSVTYEERMKMAVEGIHYGLVEHNDPYPRNIMIVQGDPDRVLWIAFDMSVTYAAVSGSITKNMLENFKFESDYVLEYGLCLVR